MNEQLMDAHTEHCGEMERSYDEFLETEQLGRVETMNNNLMVINELDTSTVSKTLDKISNFQSIVQSTLRADVDYGVIPGTQKPTLLKAGSEKICMLFGANPEYVFESKTEDYDKEFFAYTIKCTLMRNGNPVAQGVGSCNSKENKYRYKNYRENELPPDVDKDKIPHSIDRYGNKKYKLETDDSCTIANTVLKMAKKRAYVDATLQIGALSEVFTQDLEDIVSYERKEDIENMTAKEASAIVMPFGKHKGKTLKDLYMNNPDYVDWFEKNGTDERLKKAFSLMKKAVDESKKGGE